MLFPTINSLLLFWIIYKDYFAKVVPTHCQIFAICYLFIIMRPDRIVVGEVRDAAAIDMLQAMNSGHDGSLSTGHANSTVDMLNRLETLVLMGADIPLMAVRKQIASAIDIIVHLGRLRDKSRRILEVAEVLDCVDGEIEVNKLYVFRELGEDENGKVIGQLQKTNNELINLAKLSKAGIL